MIIAVHINYIYTFKKLFNELKTVSTTEISYTVGLVYFLRRQTDSFTHIHTQTQCSLYAIIYSIYNIYNTVLRSVHFRHI